MSGGSQRDRLACALLELNMLSESVPIAFLPNNCANMLFDLVSIANVPNEMFEEKERINVMSALPVI